jgi:hypothetical protein
MPPFGAQPGDVRREPERDDDDAAVGERVRRIAAYGVRMVIEDFRTDVTKTKKDGTRGRLKIDYGDRHVADHATAVIKWLWKFLDGARTPGELYGRALVVIAAERYAASRIVLPSSQLHHPQHYGSHKDLAEKALAELAGPHIPGSMKQLTKAIDAAHRALHEAEDAARDGRDGTVAADQADPTVQPSAGEESDVDGELDAEA